MSHADGLLARGVIRRDDRVGLIAPGTSNGWYTLDQVYHEEQTGQIRSAAMAAADADVDFTQYRRIFIVMNGATDTAATWSGLGTIGCGSLSSPDGAFNASTSWLKSTSMITHTRGVHLALHEGGHNLGVGHSNSRDFDTEALGAPGVAGVVAEYNDVFSNMGRGLGHYTAPQKFQLGWMPTQVQTITGSGSYVVQPLEVTGATVQALRIRRGTDNANWLWLEYRQPVGLYDTVLVSPFVFGNLITYLEDASSHIYSGGLLHYVDATTGNKTHLLDLTPQSRSGNTSPLISDDWFDTALAGTWQDPYTGVSITTSNATGSGLSVTVSYGSGPCVEANPTVSLSPSNPSAKRGAAVTLTLTVTNNDTTSCFGKTFAWSSALPPNWPTTFSVASLELSAGSSASISMTKTVPSNARMRPTRWRVCHERVVHRWRDREHHRCRDGASPQASVSDTRRCGSELSAYR
jgi:M6 family metalloprotease-like protein